MADSQGEAARTERNGEELFSYRRRLAPMLWALVAVGLVAIGAVRLLLGHWSQPLAFALGGLIGAPVIALVALIVSFGGRPVVLGPAGIKVRTGFLIDADVPFAEVAFAQSGDAPADYMPGSLLKTTLLAPPNVIVLLRRDINLPGPFGKLRRVHAVALALDEPARFLLALNARTRNSTPSTPDALAAA